MGSLNLVNAVLEQDFAFINKKIQEKNVTSETSEYVHFILQTIVSIH